MAGKENVSVAPGGTVILTSKDSIMSVKGMANDGLNVSPSVKHTTAKDPDNQIITTSKWAPWGDNDDLPLKIMDTVGQIGVLGSGIDINASLHYGNGIIWGRDVFGTEKTKKGKKTFEPESVAVWDRLKRTCEIEIVQADIVESLENFYIAFVEVILDNTEGKNTIKSARVLDTPYCRFELRKDNGRIENVFFDTNFGTGLTGDPEDKIPVYDPTNPYKHLKFVFVLSYRSWGKFYYPEQLYYACIRNGYADVAISVPKMLKAIFRNQMTLKYIIRVPFELMRKKYSNWDTPPNCNTPEEISNWQIDRMKELQTEINDHLTSEDNSGVGLFTFMDEENKGIEVEPIKNYLDTSKELPTAAAANSEFLFALQLDPSIPGLGIPGAKTLSGSGSDKRESLLIKQALLKRERLISLRFPNLIAVIEKFDDALYPTYIDMDTSQTLDQNPTGKQAVVKG